MPVELYWITPADLLAAFVAQVAVAVLAVLIAVVLLRPGLCRDCGQPAVDEAAETAELPRPHRGRLRKPHTGAVHASQATGDDTTVVIDLRETVR